MEFYLTQNGVRKGPFLVFQIKEMVDRGEALPADLGWHSGLDGWRPLSDIDAIAPFLPQKGAPSLPAATGSDPAPGSLRPVAGHPSPLELGDHRRPRAPGTETKWHLFGFRALPRFLARCLDTMLWFAFVCGAGALTRLLPATAYSFPEAVSFWFIPLQSLAWVAVEAWLLSRFGTTPGKWLFNLQVRHASGGLPPFMSALKRGFFIWVFAWGLGHPMWALVGSLISLMLYLQNGRMVWDYLVSTNVVHGKARPAGWVVFAVTLGVSMAVKFLVALGQPLPANLPDGQRDAWKQVKAFFGEIYHKNGASSTRPPS